MKVSVRSNNTLTTGLTLFLWVAGEASAGSIRGPDFSFLVLSEGCVTPVVASANQSSQLCVLAPWRLCVENPSTPTPRPTHSTTDPFPSLQRTEGCVMRTPHPCSSVSIRGQTSPSRFCQARLRRLALSPHLLALSALSCVERIELPALSINKLSPVYASGAF